MRPWLLIVVLLLQQVAPPPSSSGTAVLRGRVIEADTGRPLAQAVVTLRIAVSGAQLETTTASDGTYEFTGLPAASVSVQATSGHHRATHISRWYTESKQPGVTTRSFELNDGDVREGIDIALGRGGAISGRVVDESGEPLAGLHVRLFRAPGGQPGYGGIRIGTDDLGAFRFYNVEPGRYSVCAETRFEPRFGETVGPHRPAAPASGCYPSVTTGALGQAIVLERGDVSGIEIRLPRQPMLTISGTVLDADGAPAHGVRVSLGLSRRHSGSGTGGTAFSRGEFAISQLTPGRYSVRATLDQQGFDPGPEFQWAGIDLDLTTVDVEGLVLVMSRPATLKGRVVLDDPAASVESLTIAASAQAGFAQRPGPQARAPVTPDHRFELKGLAGPYLIVTEGLPAGWIVKTIRYRGADITEVPTEFRSGPDEIEVVLTNRPARLSGAVVDTRGNPATSGRVLAVPADQARGQWFNLRGLPIPIRDGRFSIVRRPGEYLLLALSEDAYDALGDEPPFELIEKLAERVTLREDDRRIIDLRLATLPEIR